MQEFTDVTIMGKQRDLRIKSCTVLPAENASDVQIVLDVDHRLTGGTGELDGYKNYNGPAFEAEEIGKAIDRAIANGASYTKQQAVEVLQGISKFLIIERVDPTPEP